MATHPGVLPEKITEMLETTARKGQKEVDVDVLEVLKRAGRTEGRIEGRTEERVRVLLRQLTARFGPVPAEAKARILAATGPMLARWSIRVLTEPTLEAVLGRPATAKTARKKTKKTARRPEAGKRAPAAR